MTSSAPFFIVGGDVMYEQALDRFRNAPINTLGQFREALLEIKQLVFTEHKKRLIAVEMTVNFIQRRELLA